MTGRPHGYRLALHPLIDGLCELAAPARLNQYATSTKHSGGAAGQEKTVGGFQYLNQLIQVPKKMKGGAAHATEVGMVQRVEPGATGGH